MHHSAVAVLQAMGEGGYRHCAGFSSNKIKPFIEDDRQLFVIGLEW